MAGTHADRSDGRGISRWDYRNFLAIEGVQLSNVLRFWDADVPTKHGVVDNGRADDSTSGQLR
jgi:hypothetical protein